MFIGNSNEWVPRYQTLHTEIAFKSLGNHCRVSRFVLVMIGRNIFCPSPLMHPHLQHIHLWFQRKSDSDGACPAPPYSQIINQTSINFERSSRSQGEVASTLLFKFSERKWSSGMRWDNLSNHTIALFGNDAFIQFSKLAKSGKWHCHLQRQCTRSCVTYMMQEGYQWKEDELLFTYNATRKYSNQLTLEQWAF